MHHLTCGISSLLYSVNLILFTFLLILPSAHYHLITVTNSSIVSDFKHVCAIDAIRDVTV